jgi:hypothetical protein
MLTAEELGNIEKSLDDAGMPAGLYRDGYRAATRHCLECIKSKAGEEMVQRAFVQAMVKSWLEALMHDFFGSVQQAFGKSA